MCCVFGLFFFKQKTAYEMRISDWSSDVCSSDLTEAGILRVDGSLGWRGDQVPLVLRLHGDEVLVSNTRDLRAVASPDLTVRYAAGQPLNVTGEVTELGRAPCRERVCQYV